MPSTHITIKLWSSKGEEPKLYSFRIDNRPELMTKFGRSELDLFSLEFLKDHIQQGLNSIRGPLKLTFEIIPE